ncbi:preprotein translocase subunit SecE [Alkalibaculum bacchi]|jgi:preprotein translocase subunit SecE|uniref:preprotein translocase subunit SecE n=1 Tax=Alkalibaculum bacchi TaxID=645887 RepID=UPI0026F17FAD|nr:preprotein translocase subunit SecE [Alkalibaculum bacchi]
MAKKEVKQTKEVRKSKEVKKNKESFLKSFTGFFKSVWYEIKKVNWPTRPELIQHTSVVLGIVLIMTAIVWVIDFGIGSILSLII